MYRVIDHREEPALSATEFTKAHVEPEFDRQIHTLMEKDYPALAGLTEDAFVRSVEPLRAAVLMRAGEFSHAAPAGAGTVQEPGRVPFVVVIGREMVPVERSVAATTLTRRNGQGFIDRNFGAEEIERFLPVTGLGMPSGGAHVLFDVQRGEEFCGVVPNEAMETIASRGRTPLTIEEGIALITQFPWILATNKCFSLGGSRCGDRRVPALWISKNAPKLGWCWAGNPHSWLGMASAGGRAGA